MLLTCPSFFEVFDVEILSDGLVERLWPNKSESELILGPFDQIPLITKKKVIQKTHQAAAILPNFPTQLLESQVMRENPRLLSMTDFNTVCCLSAENIILYILGPLPRSSLL